MVFFAQRAWIEGAWQTNVRLETGSDGCWKSIDVQGKQQSQDVLLGCILPGLANAHSHAFQRAMAGMAECGSQTGDNFWRWREAMYEIALKVTPDQLRAVATWLYAELLSCGYTQVCEFHYVHRDGAGDLYDQPSQMSLALVEAARDAGIGLTLLPTLYQHQGFGQRGLQHQQRRFTSTPGLMIDIRDAVTSQVRELGCPNLINAGVAIHSLRAVHKPDIAELLEGCGKHPIHIHIAEQQREVTDCLRHTGLSPIEWLLDNCPLDNRWNLVHATHTEPQELRQLAQASAAVVICPVTEANLGDGIFDLITAIDTGLRCSIGTDSHTNRDWAGELRSLEYSLRLTRQQRNVSSRRANHYRATGQVLFEMALDGSSQASGQPLAGIRVGQRADFFEINTEIEPLAGLSEGDWIDALVFSTPSHKPRRVFVAGREQSPDMLEIRRRAKDAMDQIRSA